MVDFYNQFKDFKSLEVVFHSNEKELQRIFCTVKSIENNSIILNANNQKNKNIIATVGTQLQLYIYTEMGVYSSASEVLQATPWLMNTEYVITYPTTSKHSQRREYFRAKIPVPFEMRIAADLSEEVVIKAQTKNVSGRGMSYIADNPFLSYDKIQVDLFFEDGNITTEADLVYSQQIVVNGIPKYIHAFLFTDISKKNIEFIIKKCFLHQLDLKKKTF